MTTSPALLEVRDLHTYYGASHILHGLNFSLNQGQCLSLMGRNGMGKTTTIRSVFSLTPPKKGQIFIRGVDMTGAAPYEVARAGLALVPEGRGIFPNLTVRENLVMSAHTGFGGGWTYQRVLDVFPRISERLTHMGNQLSGGEQQMLSIGRALMTNPELMVLDEATEGLAPLIRREIWSVIAEIRKAGIATILVDKDVNALLKISDRSIILAKGKIVYQDASENLIKQPDIHRQYLGV